MDIKHSASKTLRGGIAALICILSWNAGQCPAATKSYEYGNVVINSSGNVNAVPVIFRHWTHRGLYTCRLCHVDLEFSQVANGTGIMEEDNRNGMYCGACHNGKEAFGLESCTKCHPKDSGYADELEQQAKRNFQQFKKNMPPATYGNKIDWMKAEEDGIIKPKDFLPGISLKKEAVMANSRDEPRSPNLPGLPDIIFSHSKHVVWSGCGMCHPDTFALETDKTKMSMKEITQGKFCGRCHGTIAFALNDCSRCHSKSVTGQ
ncbi:MAG: c(7)-type cytochrome triheme domain-containing protein [Pseudomonadota bacterium]